MDRPKTQSTTTPRDDRRENRRRGKRQWEDVERKEGFYEQEERTTTEAWDVREATRAMKDMEID